MVWNESKPTPNDKPNLELASLITSNKLAFRQAVEKHSFWTDSSTNSIGVPRLSEGSDGPGSARAFYDVVSNVSNNATNNAARPLEGRLFLASDTSQLFTFYGPLPTVANVGGSKSVTYLTGSQATIPQNNFVLGQFGTISIVATSSGTSFAAVSFTSTYNVAPRVNVTPFSVSAHTVNLSIPAVTNITTSGFSVALRTGFGGGAYATTLMWRSFGTIGI